MSEPDPYKALNLYSDQIPDEFIDEDGSIYKMPGYPEDRKGPGRYADIYDGFYYTMDHSDEELVKKIPMMWYGRLWTDDKESCDIEVDKTHTNHYDPTGFTVIVFQLRKMFSEKVSASEAFDKICSMHDVEPKKTSDLATVTGDRLKPPRRAKKELPK